MDSLRITLLVLGVVLIVLVYVWDRVKRRKNPNRYARWGVSDDDTETHIIGRNSGDPETDTKLVSTAYEIDSRYDTPLDDESHFSTEKNNEIGEEKADVFINDEKDDWQEEVGATLQDEIYLEESEPDLDSDPEVNVNPIEDNTSELEALEEIISQESEQTEMDVGDLDIPLESVASEPERIIAVHVLARDGSSFSGADILSNLTELNLEHGDMNIFHRLDANNKTIFSLANAVEPGIFDLASMEKMTTPALLFLVSLPNTVPALEAYDCMLEAARSLTDSLNGRLCDETRSVLTRQAIDELRTELNSL